MLTVSGHYAADRAPLLIGLLEETRGDQALGAQPERARKRTATEESPNVQYIHLDWALDELIGLYLTDTAPDVYALRQEDIWLELRGLRGELQMNRLTSEVFARRLAVQPTGAHP